jgi:subtilisin family serine protease
MPAAPYHPNRILVMPAATSNLAALDQLHANHQCRVLRELPGQGNLQVVQLPTGETVPQAVARYRASGWVRFAEPDHVVSAATTLPGDPYFQNGTQWWLNNYGQNGGLPDADVDAPEAWDVLHSASTVVVAIVDTGIRLTHLDLAGNLWTNPLDGTHGFDARSGTHNPFDENGHGTHVAGIIGAIGNNSQGVCGMAWNVQLMACKFLDASGNGFNSDAATCIEFARTNGAQVINLSWGGGEYSQAVSNALWLAQQDNILIAAAAGNDVGNIDVFPYYPASLPLNNMVSVGASTRTDAAWFRSGHGATNVDLFAPGVTMLSTYTNSDSAYFTRDGTSMATACVAGALALLRQQHPTARASELVGTLLGSVDFVPTFAGKCATGGRLNLRKALDQPSVRVVPQTWPIALQVTGVPLHTYRLTSTTNLATWTGLATNVTGFDGVWTFTDTDSTSAPFKFYQALPGP